jgi:hypothetical protein
MRAGFIIVIVVEEFNDLGIGTIWIETTSKQKYLHTYSSTAFELFNNIEPTFTYFCKCNRGVTKV